MGGERLVALDLVDTKLLAANPPIDLIETPEQLAKWWKLQAARLPTAPTPATTAVHRLRTAIRDVLDSHLTGKMPSATSIEDLNATAAAAPQSLRLVAAGNEVRRETRWHPEYGGNAALASIARETIELLADPGRLDPIPRLGATRASGGDARQDPRRCRPGRP